MFCATACTQHVKLRGFENTWRRTYLDKPGMSTPPVNHAPFYSVPKVARLALPIELVQTAPRRATAVLGILRERDRALDAIRLHLPGRLVREGTRIAERDIALVGCRGRVQFVKNRGHAFALEFRVVEDRGTTTYVFILLLDLWCAASRYPWREDGLEGQGDEITVHEEVLEEVVGLGYLNKESIPMC